MTFRKLNRDENDRLAIGLVAFPESLFNTIYQNGKRITLL